ncbi:unnamed protein product, partial [Ectocarpus sp. 12 AP-2014]
MTPAPTRLRRPLPRWRRHPRAARRRRSRAPCWPKPRLWSRRRGGAGRPSISNGCCRHPPHPTTSSPAALETHAEGAPGTRCRRGRRQGRPCGSRSVERDMLA